MISELQVPHPDGEFKQFQRCEADVVVSRLLAGEGLRLKAPPPCPGPIGGIVRIRRGIINEGHNRYAHREEKVRKRRSAAESI